MTIKFFADTASLQDIEYCFSREVNDGITTNPKILETTGELPLGFEKSYKKLLEKHSSIKGSNLSSKKPFKIDFNNNLEFEKACQKLIEKHSNLGLSDIIEKVKKRAEISFDDLPVGFEKACKQIVEKYPNVPVSLETDLKGMNINEINLKKKEVVEILLSQAFALSRLGDNVVIKIPICEAGVSATKILSEKGIKTNVTACMNPFQALEAARAGATYVSLFANRMLDSHILELSGNSLRETLKNPNWKEILKTNKEKYFDTAWGIVLNQISYVAEKVNEFGTELIVGSIRGPEDIYKIVKAEPHIITIPTKIVTQLKEIPLLKRTNRSIFPNGDVDLLYHPMTNYTLEEFEKAADSYRK